MQGERELMEAARFLAQHTPSSEMRVAVLTTAARSVAAGSMADVSQSAPRYHETVQSRATSLIWKMQRLGYLD